MGLTDQAQMPVFFSYALLTDQSVDLLKGLTFFCRCDPPRRRSNLELVLTFDCHLRVIVGVASDNKIITSVSDYAISDMRY